MSCGTGRVRPSRTTESRIGDFGLHEGLETGPFASPRVGTQRRPRRKSPQSRHYSAASENAKNIAKTMT